MSTIFDLCTPREDVLKGAITESDFAADLSQVIRGKDGPAEYLVPAKFFANTYPTRGLKNLLANVCARLSGKGGEVAAIFRLDTTYGGGKTHALIALLHAARGMEGVTNVAEFIDAKLIPKRKVRIAAFDGENADPANGRHMGDDVYARTPWGEIAYALAGKAGYERVRKSDELVSAPGAETIRELFGGEPTLILLDELSVYIRKVHNLPNARDQLTAFLTSLFKAIEGTPNAALVYTLAIGKDGKATDAYSDENQFIADRMAEAESVSARKATLLNPTEDDETVQVLRRRLFTSIDDAKAAVVIDGYRAQWAANKDALPAFAGYPETVDAFRKCYPLHPEILETLTSKTATLQNFQRVRGMLRLLARTVSSVWQKKPADATAIHLHHIDLGYEPIRQEIITRLQQGAYAPAMSNDVAGTGGKRSLAEDLDYQHYKGAPPYTEYVARTVFLHSLAYNDPLKGLNAEHLRYSMLCPALDMGFIEDARKRFLSESAYLDDRPGVPMRFLRRGESDPDHSPTGAARRSERVSGAVERPDQGHFQGASVRDRFVPRWPVRRAGRGGRRPSPARRHVVRRRLDWRHRRCTSGADRQDFRAQGLRCNRIPRLPQSPLVRRGRRSAERGDAAQDEPPARARRPQEAGAVGGTRRAPAGQGQGTGAAVGDRGSNCRTAVLSPRFLSVAKSHWRKRGRSRAYSHRHPVHLRQAGRRTAASRPGAARPQKLRLQEDDPDSPTYIRDRTPLKKGQITTLALREEFRRDPGLPMLVGDDIFIRGVRKGVEAGEYVYRRGELLYGQGDPSAAIEISEQAVIFTTAYAKEHNIWPRPPVVPPPGTGPGTGASTGAGTGTGTGTGSTPPPPPPPGSLTAEGLLKEALTKLWEQARGRKIEAIASLTVRLFEAGDAFRLMGAVGAISGAKKTVRLAGGYETKDGGTLEMEFHGPVSDAAPVKEFLDAQLRSAASTTMEAGFEIVFDTGLPMTGDAAEKFTERLTKFASGAAYVSASAEAAK